MIQSVSVVMATYNGGGYIGQQIESILNQTYPFKELIISDDGSTDNTIEVIKQWAEKDNRIVLIKNNGKHGIKDNFLNGFTKSTGDIIAPADQDDIWYACKLEQLVAHITDDIDVVNAQDIIIYEDGSKAEDVWYIPGIDETIWRNKLKGHTCIFKRSLLELYNHSGYNSWDYVLSFFCCLTRRYITLPDFTMEWRRHKDAVTFGSFHKVADVNNVGTTQINCKKRDNNLKKWDVFFWVNTQLINGFKHFSFSRATKSRANLIKYIAKSFDCKDASQALLFSNVLEWASRESIFGFFMSGLYSVKGHSHTLMFKSLEIKNKLARIMWAFREPYNQYYVVRNDKYIG